MVVLARQAPKMNLSIGLKKYNIEGVYPQSEGSLAIVGIDSTKGFVDLWVHFFVGIVDIHRNGYRQKVLFFGFD